MQLGLSAELGFGFCWVRASFFFSSDSGWDCAHLAGVELEIEEL